MNFEHYKNFVTIVDCRNISAAAAHLHIAQSALSNQVKALEEEFGAKLLIRGPRYVEMTDAGALFYKTASDMMHLEETAKKEIRERNVGRKGTLKLGMTPALPDRRLEQILQEFCKNNPEISYELYEANSNDLIEYLKNGIIEVAIIRTPEFVPGFLEVALTTEELFYLYANRRMAARFKDSDIGFDALKDVPLSVPRGFRRAIVERCRSCGFEPHLFSVSSSRNAALMWAETGKAAAVLAGALEGNFKSDKLVRLPIRAEGIHPRRSIVTLRGRKQGIVTGLFLESCIAQEHKIRESF